MIIYNPENGAEIKNVYFENVLYFSEKEGKTFKPDSLLNVGDREGLFFTTLFEFLREVTPEEAKKIIEKQNAEFKCDQCEFRTATKIALSGHNRSHENKTSVDELGIPVLGGTKRAEVVDLQSQYDAADRANGLTGEGLVIESQKGAIFK